MFRHLPIIGAIFAAGLIICGCGPSYSGDGHLIDAGYFSTPRYELDLGPVDLAQVGTHRYRLVGLPDVELTVGFEITESKPNRFDGPRPSHPSIIRLELENSDHRIVASEYGSLDSWVWSFGQDQSSSFLYRRGEQTEIPIGNGVVRLERLGVKADGGWGTYFMPTRIRSYELTLDVVEGEQPPPRVTRLLLQGGGWK